MEITLLTFGGWAHWTVEQSPSIRYSDTLRSGEKSTAVNRLRIRQRFGLGSDSTWWSSSTDFVGFSGFLFLPPASPLNKIKLNCWQKRPRQETTRWVKELGKLIKTNENQLKAVAIDIFARSNLYKIWFSKSLLANLLVNQQFEIAKRSRSKTKSTSEGVYEVSSTCR